MMYQKALLFGDRETADLILAADHARDQKELGRAVKHFDDQIWSTFREGIAFTGNYAKFSQNRDLADKLLDTAGRILAEASPTDFVWGIGLSESDPKALDPSAWRGQNLLGITLMRVRAALRQERELSAPIRN